MCKAGHDAVLVFCEPLYPRALGFGSTWGGDHESNSGTLGRGELVERGPVLPALTLGQRLLVDDPRSRLTLASLDHADALQQGRNDLVLIGADGLVLPSRLKKPLGNAWKTCDLRCAIEPEQIDPGPWR